MYVIVYSHTHWDREWYRPFQDFRFLLVEVVNQVLNLLQANVYKYFLLDGQTIILEDYLEIIPENKKELIKWIKSGKLIVGPWYVLPDEFLVNGESLIRNLLLGKKISEEFGKSNKVGYLPDMFGHISQMPQILKGFGFDCAVVWRGVNPEKSEFLWESPDGTRIFTVYLPLGYYNLFDNISKISNKLDVLKKFSSTDVLLLPNGGDHISPIENLNSIIKEFNKENKEYKMVQGTISEYVNLVRSKRFDFPVIKGELRNCERSFILPGVLSTRNYLKQINYKLQILLEYWVEPLCTWNWLMGNSYPENMIWTAWKYLLQNHPHDSICGCSIDQVHKEMMIRFDWCTQLSNQLLKQTLDKLNDIFSETNNFTLVIFNLTSWNFTGVLEDIIQFPDNGEKINFILEDNGSEIPYEVLYYDKILKFHADTNSPPYWENLQQNKILFEVKDIKPFSFKTYKIIQNKTSQLKIEPKVYISDKSLENDFIKIEVLDNGALKIIDKKNNVEYINCNLFIDEGDTGDEYNYSPPFNDKTFTSDFIKSSIFSSSNLQGTIKIDLNLLIPKSLSYDRRSREIFKINCPITSYITLKANSPVIHIHTELKNLSEDHRLRVIFPYKKGKKDNVKCLADSQFSVIERPINEDSIPIDVPIGKERVEPTFPFQNFIDIIDDENGLLMLSQGLLEGEILSYEEDTLAIALTLLRCVGWLSRNDLRTRKQGAGPELFTPGAQCIGEFEFNYYLIPHNKNENIFKLVYQQIIGTYSLQTIPKTKNDNSFLKIDYLFNIEPENLIISSIKKSENCNGIILRLYNPTSNSYLVNINTGFKFKKVYLTRLDETEIEELQHNDNKINFNINGFKIITIKFIT